MTLDIIFNHFYWLQKAISWNRWRNGDLHYFPMFFLVDNSKVRIRALMSWFLARVASATSHQIPTIAEPWSPIFNFSSHHCLSQPPLGIRPPSSKASTVMLEASMSAGTLPMSDLTWHTEALPSPAPIWGGQVRQPRSGEERVPQIEKFG